MFILDFLNALYQHVLGVLNEMPAHSTNPISAGWFLFLNGGWIIVVVFSIVTIEHLWVEWLEEKWEHAQTYILLNVEVPRLNEQSPKAIENIFAMVWGTGGKPQFIPKYVKGWGPNRMSFEIVSHEGHIHYYIRCRDKIRDLVEAAVYSEYPLAEIQQVEDYVDAYPRKWPNEEYDMAGTEFVMTNKDNYPIRTWPFFEDKLIGEFKDPLAHVIEVMNKLGQGELLSFQLAITPADSEWKKTSEALIAKIAGIPVKEEKHAPGLIKLFVSEAYNMVELVVHTFFGAKGSEVKKDEKTVKMAFTPLEKEALDGLSMKASKVGFKTKMRAAYLAPKGAGKGGARLSELSAALAGFASHNLNSFGRHWPSAIKSDYSWHKGIWSYYLTFGFYRPAPIRTMNMFSNFRGRSIGTAAAPYIMCTEELATLWHFPTALIKSPLLRKIEAKRSEPPSNVPFREDMLFPSQIKDAAAHGSPEPKQESHGGGHGGHEEPSQEVPENLPFV
ncbi:MAG: hypothetical protein WCJ29_01240 [bacterium]